jgi:DNA modification methylase
MENMRTEKENRFEVIHGDCIPGMAEMQAESVDFSISSVPFPSVFSYTSSEADIGNSEDLNGEARVHFSFFFRQLRRIVKPGRVICIHCMQIARLKRSGEVGLFDFRGLLIRLGVRVGLVYEYDWLVAVNPQMQAIRTKKWELKFQGLEKDRAISRGALCDYVLKFRVPGENAVPVNSPDDVSRGDWIRFAEGAWPYAGEDAIRRTYTLNTARAKGENDTKHICPLQLDIIDRCVRLYSNPGELVYTPFAGIGSEMYVALKLGRRARGHELKDEYFNEAIRNCERAIAEQSTEKQESLFPAAKAG